MPPGVPSPSLAASPQFHWSITALECSRPIRLQNLKLSSFLQLHLTVTLLAGWSFPECYHDRRKIHTENNNARSTMASTHSRLCRGSPFPCRRRACPALACACTAIFQSHAGLHKSYEQCCRKCRRTAAEGAVPSKGC